MRSGRYSDQRRNRSRDPEISEHRHLAELPDVAELRDIVDDIVRDNRRASEVIRKIRGVMKKAPFDPKKLDLNEVVRETVEFLSRWGSDEKLN